MQTSLIAYPQQDRFIRVHESILAACNNNSTAAALVSFLEYWHNYHIQRIEYLKEFNGMLEHVGEKPILELNGWQYHTDIQLERGLMISKKDSIRKAITLLESIGFISTEVPERLVLLHKTGRTKWFLLMTNRVNEWLKDYAYKTGKRTVKTPSLAPVTTAPAEISEDVQTVFDYRTLCRKEYNRKHGRKDIKEALTQKRIDAISRAFAHSKLWEICLALEGNLLSEFHQGDNPKKKIYDRLDLILRDRDHVEQFARYAYEAGLSRATVEAKLDPEYKAIDEDAEKSNGDYSRTFGRTLGKVIIRDDELNDSIITLSAIYDIDLLQEPAATAEAHKVLEGELGMVTSDHVKLLNTVLGELRANAT